jgi:hypothetical protein
MSIKRLWPTIVGTIFAEAYPGEIVHVSTKVMREYDRHWDGSRRAFRYYARDGLIITPAPAGDYGPTQITYEATWLGWSDPTSTGAPRETSGPDWDLHAPAKYRIKSIYIYGMALTDVQFLIMYRETMDTIDAWQGMGIRIPAVYKPLLDRHEGDFQYIGESK